MTALTARNTRLADLIRAVLVLEWPLPVPTQAIAERVSRRWDPDVYRMLRRMEHHGDAERIKDPDSQSVYWRLTEPPNR